jgi:hypothetical protein
VTHSLTSHDTSLYQVQVSRDRGSIEFAVRKPSEAEWMTNPDLNPDFLSCWGLWETDVVEVFFKRKADPFYYEIQVSPQNQRFQLQVIKPREIIATPLDLVWSHHSSIEGDLWRTKIEIPFEDELLGNYHACLGSPEARNYFSLIKYPGLPDFHRPQLFEEI